MVVLPDIGASDEHDFELLLMPAMGVGEKMLKQLVGEDSRGLWGAQRLDTPGRGNRAISASLFLSVFNICPLPISSQGAHVYLNACL